MSLSASWAWSVMPMVASLPSTRTHSCDLEYSSSGGVLDIARGSPTADLGAPAAPETSGDRAYGKRAPRHGGEDAEQGHIELGLVEAALHRKPQACGLRRLRRVRVAFAVGAADPDPCQEQGDLGRAGAQGDSRSRGCSARDEREDKDPPDLPRLGREDGHEDAGEEAGGDHHACARPGGATARAPFWRQDHAPGSRRQDHEPALRVAKTPRTPSKSPRLRALARWRLH